MSDKRLYLIDATAFCYRAFYALQPLSTSFGQPTNSIYGFINILNKILKDEKPEYLAACFDVSRDTFRTRKFAEYKVQRPAMPEGLSSQLPFIKEIIRAYGIALFEKEGFEADDIIATLTKKAKEHSLKVTIISSDKDMLQLVDEDTHVLNPYKDEGVEYDIEKVKERFGVEPQRISDVIALMGDSSDNIPSVPGVGEKTAAVLIKQFGSLDELLKQTEKIKQEKIRQAIEENADMINLNKELAQLDSSVKIDFEFKDLKLGEPDSKELYRIYKHLEFKKFLKGLAQEEEGQEIKPHVLKDPEVSRLISREEGLILYGEGLDNLTFCSGTRIFRVEDPAKILSSHKILKIGHDLKRLKSALNKEGMVLEGLSFDCMIAAYLLNPSKSGYTLSDIAWDYLERPPGKTLDSATGADLIRRLKPKLEKELEEKSLLKLFNDLEMPLVEVLAEMEIQGIKLDLKVLKELSATIEKRLVRLIEEIYDLSGTQFNINSTLQLRQVLFEKLKLPVIKKGKTGPSTDEEVLNRLAKEHKLPGKLLEYRQLMKLKTTYIDTLPKLVDEGGRIHTSFNQDGTETGRLSSSNPNLQNIPVKTDIGKNIRRAVIASAKDNRLLSCDYSQIELRVLAHLSKDRNLIAAIKENKDIHKATAALIFGAQEKDVSSEMRETAKRVNFGIVYGLTSFGLSRDLGIPPDEAQAFIDAYFERYPKVKDYIQEQIEKAEKDGFVTTLLGRRRYIPEIKNKNIGIRQFAQRQAVNTPIQGSASDLIKLAMVDIHNIIHDKKLKARMLLQIHDELVFDVPLDELKELVKLVKERMENVLKLDVPVKVDIKVGRNWLEMEDAK